MIHLTSRNTKIPTEKQLLSSHQKILSSTGDLPKLSYIHITIILIMATEEQKPIKFEELADDAEDFHKKYQKTQNELLQMKEKFSIDADMNK